MKAIQYGDYIFIEEEFKVVELAEVFKTLPVKYEKLRKYYEIVGKASKQAILIAADMNPQLTIVLQKKVKKAEVKTKT